MVTVSKAAPLLLFGVLAAAACADDESSSTDEQPASEPRTDAGSTTLDGAATDSSVTDAREDDASVEADAEVPRCSKEGWCRLDLPTDATKTTLVGVWSDGDGIAWAVSTEGDILRWDGTSWSVARPGTDPLYSIWGSSPTDVWVTGAAGILHGTGTNSASLTWSLEPLDSLPGDPTTPFVSVGGTSPTDVWVAGSRRLILNGGSEFGVNRVLRYLGPGANPAWAVETDISTGDTLPPDTHSGIRWLRVLGTSTGVYLVGSTRGMNQPDPSVKYGESVKYRVALPDGSAVWNEIYNSVTPNIDTPGPCRTFMLTAGDYDNVTIAAGARGNRVWLAGGSSSELYAIGDFNPATTTATWTCSPFAVGDSIPRKAIWVTGDNEAWAVGDFGRVSHFDGTTWKTAGVSATTLPMTQNLSSIWGDNEALWVVGKGIALRKLLNP